MGDNIKKPDHYCEGREYEPKDVIRDWGLNFNLGSAVKYISRAGRKGDKLEDLKKARQFLEFEIETEEKANKSELSEKLFKNHVNAVLNGTMYMTDFLEPYQKKIIDRIVEMIDKDELDCFDISADLYCGYQDIRDAIARQAFRKVGEEQKSDIGMTCKDAAEIGDAMAKGFKDGIKEAQKTRFVDLNTGKDIRLKQEESDTFTFSFEIKEETEQEEVLSLADIISMIMKHNRIPEPDVIKLQFKFEDDPTAIPANTVSIKFHTNRKEI